MHFAPLGKQLHVDWVDLDDVDPAYFVELHEYACVTRVRGQWFIGLHPKFKVAPRYVVRYLIFHEVLHVALQTFEHPRHFHVAERLWPDYQRANAWLATYYRKVGLA
jgi:hypothetical protein